MGLIIQITNTEWRNICRHILENHSEALCEGERKGAAAFIEMGEPFAETTQLELMRKPVDSGELDFDLEDVMEISRRG